MVLGLVLAILIGVALGALGGGGSILAVPVFVYVLGFGAKEAIAASLVVVGATSLFGVLGHWRSGNVNPRVALVFGSVAMAGTYAGARLAAFFSGSAQLVLFAAVMLLAAYFMLREEKDVAVGLGAVHGHSGSRSFYWLIVVEGLAVGVITGLVGVGGGFLVVPALVILGGLPIKQAIGTSLLVIAMKSVAGLAGYVGQVEVECGFIAVFTVLAMVGAGIGTRVAQFLPGATLRRYFAVLLVLMSFLVLYQNLTEVLG